MCQLTLERVENIVSLTADLTRPVILAEITPDRLYHGYPFITEDFYSRGYNLIVDIIGYQRQNWKERIT